VEDKAMRDNAAHTANPFESKTFGQAIEILAERYGEHRALVFRDRRYSFRDVKMEVDKASRRLATLGLVAGDTIAIWLPNRPEFIWYWLGASQMGLLTVFMNTRLKQSEFMYQIAQSQSRALITAGAGAFRNFLGELCIGCPQLALEPAGSLKIPELPDLRHVIALDPPADRLSGVTDWSARPDGSGPLPPLQSDPDRPALIGYSSGTTALPKGAMLTHCVWRKAWDGGALFDLTEDDCLFHTVPLFGVLGFLSGVLMFWTHGSGIVLDDKFEAARCIRLMRDERCTCVHLLPVMIEEILAHPDFPAGGLPGLRAGIVLSNDPAVMRRAAEKLGVRGASAGYGMTESTGLVTRGKWDAALDERLKSHGPPLPGCEIRVVDPDTGKDLPVGETGEIWIGGYSVMAGYYNKPAETAETITADGWLRSGDAGYLNPDGTLVFLHRLKDGYKHNGFNVSTPEIEAVMRSHPAVAAAAVVGIPHDRFGEIGVAFAIAKPQRAVDGDEVLAFLRERLASFKLPAGIIFVDEFPLTAGTEKIQKFKLKQVAIERFGHQATPSKPAKDQRAGRPGQ
jgi:fatty-acyl-CoA synthase